MKNKLLKVKLFRGFTLVEIMVAISIVAILSVIGLTVYTKAMISARDAKRLADMHAIQQALEEYHLANGFYPKPTQPSNVSPSTLTGIAKYFTNGEIPHDPNIMEGGATVGRPTIGFDYGYLACVDTSGVTRQYYLCSYISDCSGKCNVDTELGKVNPSPIPGVGHVTEIYSYPCDSPNPIKPFGQGKHFYCLRSQQN